MCGGLQRNVSSRGLLNGRVAPSCRSQADEKWLKVLDSHIRFTQSKRYIRLFGCVTPGCRVCKLMVISCRIFLMKTGLEIRVRCNVELRMMITTFILDDIITSCIRIITGCVKWLSATAASVPSLRDKLTHESLSLSCYHSPSHRPAYRPCHLVCYNFIKSDDQRYTTYMYTR